MIDDTALFDVMLGAGSVRIETTPDGVIRLLGELTPRALTALMLIINHTGRGQGAVTADWLAAQGMDVADAHDAIDELRATNYLPTEHFTVPPARPQPPIVTPERPKPVYCRACGRHKPPGTREGEVTYVVERDGYVKIGTTRHLRLRIQRLAQSDGGGVLVPPQMDPQAPLRLLGILSAPEHECHERFVDCHVIGEWFQPSREMSRVLASEVTAP